jgi:hypothetical protein
VLLKPDKKDVGVQRPPTAHLLPVVAQRKFGFFRLRAAYSKLTQCLVAKEEQNKDSTVARGYFDS